MASFSNASFNVASFNVASFFFNDGSFVYTPTEFRLFFRANIDAPQVGFQTTMSDKIGGSVTMKDNIAARVELK